jgi:hypothetical protein
MRRRVIAAGVLGIAAGVVALFPAMAEDALPAKAYIEGVPFVEWHDMRDAEFPNSDVVNPSYTASAEMMFRYWGGDFLAYSGTQAEYPGWTSSGGANGRLEDLKSLLARGVPVHVSPATTPEAHRLYVVPKMCAAFQDVKYTAPRPASGALGEMIVLEAVDQLRAGGCETGLNDSVFLATRLLVGYDDERQVFVMHDPSLGPNLELGYEEFERMWRATAAKYWAVHPESIPVEAPARVGTVRGRTSDDDAAVALFRAYGLEIAGRYAEAEPVLREALALEGLSAGRRHLLGLELAVTLNETGRCDEAISTARQANAQFGDYALGHALLGNLLACSGDRSASKEAKRDLSRAKGLCSAKAQRRVADELGRDFHVMGCQGELLGWYRP